MNARMVGREVELGRLLALLDDAEAGRAMVALVSGDAGIGKSRLVTEACTLAGRRGFTVLSGQCAELGDSVPYLPLADALRSATVAGAPATDALRHALSSRPALSRLLPDGANPDPDADRAELARQQMFGAVLGLLAELALSSPVMLVLEDLHWADASTRDLVTFLSRMLHRERIVIVGTYRADDLHRRHPLRPVIAELQRLPNVQAISLGPLDNAAMAEHLRASGPVNGLEAADLNRIVARAEGNAYYAEELLAASDRSLPAGLSALLLNRVEQLSDKAQRVLRTAAVAGRRADDELVRLVSGLSSDEYEDAVRQAVTHQLLVPEGDVGYRFRHALLREAIYADLLPGERTRLHGAMSALLAEPARLAVPGTAAQLARHCLASHDIPGAFSASIKAGKEAEQLGAPAEAHRHYDEALGLWDRVENPDDLAGLSRARLALKSASNAAQGGNVPRAIHQLRRMRHYLSQASPPDPEMQIRVGERLAYFLWLTDDEKAMLEAQEVARSTVETCPSEPATWYYARAVATYAQTMLNQADMTEARQWAERALEAARRAQAQWVEADALATLGYITNREGENDEAIKLLTEAHRLAKEAMVLGVELQVAFSLGRTYLEVGELSIGAAIAHEGVTRASRKGLGMAPFGLDLQHLHFQFHYADGAWDHAQEIAGAFPVRVTTSGEALLSAMALFIDVARGNQLVDERVAWLAPFWPGKGFEVYISRGILADHYLWRGDTARAIEEAEAAIDEPYHSEYGYSPSTIRPATIAISAWADRAVQARASGEDPAVAVAEARRLLDIAREGTSFPKRPKFVLGPEGRGWAARAEAEFRRAAGANDPEAWRAVLAEFGPGYKYENARTRLRLAEALAEAGQRDEAAAEWELAAAAADELKARPLRQALDDLARRARLGTVAEDTGAHAAAGLTSREREVLRLIAAGRSNREIAAALFITAKTASVHVSNILGKLGAASRTEAAAIAHREGLIEP